MIQTCLYAVVMIAITIFTITKKKNVMGRILFALYTAIAIAAVIAIHNGFLSTSKVSISAYIYLIIIFAISFFPYTTKKYRFNVEKLSFIINKKYLAFAWMYLLSSVICVLYYLPHVRTLYAIGNWIQNRSELYSGSLYSSYRWYEYYALQFNGYTKVLALVTGFALIRNLKHSKLGIAVIISAALSSCLSSIYQSSRGGIVNLVLLILALYIFFYNDLENNKKRAITIISIGGIIMITPYLIDVTISRFSAGGALRSLLSYFGQSPVVFNSGVFPITKHLYGRYAFGNLFGPDGFNPSQIGGTWGSGFYTFVGWLYIDWGIFGTVIVAIVLSSITIYFIQKKVYCIADLYMIFFIYYTLLQGVFVIGRDYCYNILVSVIIYVFVKLFFDKVVFMVGNKKLLS